MRLAIFLRFFHKLILSPWAWPNLRRLFSETVFYMLRKRASLGRALQVQEQSRF
jgi:hypothetical protein